MNNSETKCQWYRRNAQAVVNDWTHQAQCVFRALVSPTSGDWFGRPHHHPSSSCGVVQRSVLVAMRLCNIIHLYVDPHMFPFEICMG